MNMNKHIG